MRALGDYIHSLGLKFGIYSDAGTRTCQGRPGSRGYEFQDARSYAEWGVDYLKYDWCNSGTQSPIDSYRIMRDALHKAGHPIVFSICEWGTTKPWLWAEDIGHLWRSTDDILDCWNCTTSWGGMGWPLILDKQVGLEVHAGPGHWNDPDMLQVGNDSLTVSESRAHFSLWGLLAAPLMAGNDLRAMSDDVSDILTNEEVISIDQDVLGRQGYKVRDDGDLEVWVRQLHDGSRAVVLFNRGETDQDMTVNWTEMGYPSEMTVTVRDLWLKRDLGSFSGHFTASVPSHDVIMVRITP
jgi:alpha-galactosidase